MRIVLPVLIAASLLLVIFTACNNSQSCPKIGDKAPDFTLTSLDGQNISLSSFAGKPVIINTWSTVCISCKKEMPYFQELYEKYSSQGLIVLMINTADSISDTKAFLSKNSYTFPVIFDLKWDVRNKKFCRNADPCTFLINKDGIITFISLGEITSKDILFNEVQKVLSPK